MYSESDPEKGRVLKDIIDPKKQYEDFEEITRPPYVIWADVNLINFENPSDRFVKSSFGSLTLTVHHMGKYYIGILLLYFEHAYCNYEKNYWWW